MAPSAIRIVPQGDILKGAPEPPALRLPDPKSFFSSRAARFEALAMAGHADASFLRMMGRLAQAQQKALDTHPEPVAPDASHLALCRRHGLPPLGKDGRRSPAWREALTAVLLGMRDAVPKPAQRAIRELEATSPESVEAMADRLLEFDYPALDPVAVPFLGAALQVHWLKRAAALGEAALTRLDIPNVCPACGSPPVASALRIDIPVPGVRYLHCSLCSTDWQLARGQCSQCRARDKVAYFHVDGGSEAVKAEACDECHSYRKIFNMEMDALVDPVADDLASLALDLLMDESGYQRTAPNILFAPGDT